MVSLMVRLALPNITAGQGVLLVWAELVVVRFVRWRVQTVAVIFHGKDVTAAIFRRRLRGAVWIRSFRVCYDKPPFMYLSRSKTVAACRWRWWGRGWRRTLLFLWDVPDWSIADSAWSGIAGASRVLNLWTLKTCVNTWHLKVRKPIIGFANFSQAVAVSTIAVIAVLSSCIPLAHFIEHVLCWGSVALWEGVVWCARAGGEGAVGWVSFPPSQVLHTVIGLGRWQLTGRVRVWHML